MAPSCRASSAQRASWNARRASPAAAARPAPRGTGWRSASSARGHHPGGQLEQLVVEQAREQRADLRALGGDQRADGLLAQRLVDRLLARAEMAIARREHERGHAPAQAEGLQPPRELGAGEPARHDLGQHVARQAPLGGLGHVAAQQLERDHRHRLVQDQPVELRQPAGVLGGHQPGLRHRALGPDRQRQRAAAQVALRRREAAAVAAPRAVAQLGRQLLDGLRRQLAAEGPLRQRRAAAVEHERAAADERRQRAGDRVQAALGEHDPLQALLRGDRALQHGVLLVDQPRERLLGDGDERRRVRDLEDRERRGPAAAFDQRRGHLFVREAGPDARARPGRGRPGGARSRAGLLGLRAPSRW